MTTPTEDYAPKEEPQNVDELPPETALFDVLMEALHGEDEDDLLANGIIAHLELHADVVERWLETQRTSAYLSLPEGTTPAQAGQLAYSLLRNWGFVTHAQITKKGLHFGATLPDDDALDNAAVQP